MAAQRHLIDQDGNPVADVGDEEIARRLEQDGLFWLDIEQPGPAELRLLRDVFGFHPLAVEDSEHFDQRPKIDDYERFAFLVVYAPGHGEGAPVEVHCFQSARYLVTLRRDVCPSLAEARERLDVRDQHVVSSVRLLYRVVDGMVGSYFPLLDSVDERIDQLEDEVFGRADQTAAEEIFALKRRLVALRRVVTPQRDMFASSVATTLKGMTPDDDRYFRDVYDHLIRISDMIDTYRDLLAGAMDLYLSTVSNRLNVVMKQLAAISTLFLPLTFLTRCPA
jgi:magnesium transporter